MSVSTRPMRSRVGVILDSLQSRSGKLSRALYAVAETYSTRGDFTHQRPPVQRLNRSSATAGNGRLALTAAIRDIDQFMVGRTSTTVDSPRMKWCCAVARV